MNQIIPSGSDDDEDDDDISSSSSFVSLVSLTMNGHNNNNNNSGDSSNNRHYHTNSSIVTTTNNNHDHETTKASLAPKLASSSSSSSPPSSWQPPTSPSTLAAMGMASTLTFLVSSGARSRGLYDVFAGEDVADDESGANAAAGQDDGCGNDDDGEDAIPALDEDEEEKETKPDEEETYLEKEEDELARKEGDEDDDDNDDESVDGSNEDVSRDEPEEEESHQEPQGKVEDVEEAGSKTNGKGNIFQFYNPAEFEFQIHLSGHGNDDGEDEAKNEHGNSVIDDGNDNADVNVNGNGNDDLDVGGNVDDSEKATGTIIANAIEGAKWKDVVPSIDTDGNLCHSHSLAELSTVDNAHTNLMANDSVEKVTTVVPSFEDVANFATVDAIGATSREREENSVESTNLKDCFEENYVQEEFETNSQARPLPQQPPIDETSKIAETTTATSSTSATAPPTSSTFFSSIGEWLTQLCGVGNDNHFCSYDCFDAASAENEKRQSKDAGSDFKVSFDWCWKLQLLTRSVSHTILLGHESLRNNLFLVSLPKLLSVLPSISFFLQSNSTIHQEGNETAKEETERPSTTTNATAAERTQDGDEVVLPSMPPESTSFSPSSSSTPVEERDAQNNVDDDDGDGIVTVAVAVEEEEEDMATKRGALHHSTTTTETATNTWMATMMKANHSRKDGCNSATVNYDSNIMSREDLLTSIRHTADSHKMGKEQYLRLLSALAGN